MTEPETSGPTLDDHRVARLLAIEAGELLVSLRVDSGLTGQQLKDAGDLAAHELLMARLAECRPTDPVLSEEGAAAESAAERAHRLGSSRAWIVDPLDGTREFSEPPRTDWAVHVALSIDGRAVCGAVALPALGLTFGTDDPPSVTAPPPVPRVIVSRSRPPAEALALADALGATLVEMGSAGAKVMAIVRGLADIYPHSGGQYEWDSCAPVAVALAAGLVCTRLDGSPLEYNRLDPYLPDLLIARPQHHAAALAALGVTSS